MLLVKTENFLKKLPNSTGVYLFKNKKSEIIYVGRAASLKNRVASYFVFRNQTSNTRSPVSSRRPIEQLISEVYSVSYEKTSNLLEAAVLENNFIKKYLPKYNIKDKDNKSFVYLFFDVNTDFPKPLIIRGRDMDKYKPKKGIIVGPYQSQHVLKKILFVARRLFPYSTCLPADRPAQSFSGKPCFHYQIGLCPGVCIDEISSKEYKKIINKLIKFLKAPFPKTKKKIDDITLLPGKDAFLTNGGFSRIEGYDISHFQKGTAYGAMVVFKDSRPFKNDYRLFKMREAKTGDDTAAFKEVLERRLKHNEWPYPDLIVIDGGRQQVNAVCKTFKNAEVNIPVIGLAKIGGHSQSVANEDILIFETGLKKPIRGILFSQKKLFQQVRNEAHRFSLKALRRSQKL